MPHNQSLTARFVQQLGPGCLAGIRMGDWCRLLAENQFHVAPRYWGKAAHLTVASAITSPLAWLESFLYAPAIKSTQVEPPLFVLGSWRSGTTFLHNLLCQDERFAAPDLYQTMYPSTFRLSRWWWEPLVGLGLPRKRFMDNVSQGLREPAEDEMALAILSGKSNMLSWAFPGQEAYYERYLSFRKASPREREAFLAAFDFFVRKVQHATGKPLILKSPNHTGRISLLRELYPAAKFVHIHRHPYEVFRSLRHMAESVIPVWGLQEYPDSQLDDMVIRLYRELYLSYFAERDEIPPGHLLEVSYDQLSEQPLAQMRNIYQQLQLPDFAAVEPRLQQYLDSLKTYERNRHPEIPAPLRSRLHHEWDFCFDAWNYDRAEAA